MKPTDLAQQPIDRPTNQPTNQPIPLNPDRFEVFAQNIRKVDDDDDHDHDDKIVMLHGEEFEMTNEQNTWNQFCFHFHFQQMNTHLIFVL